MIACVQRCARASVRVNDEEIAATGPGLVILLGVEKGDDESSAAVMAEKLSHLRIFDDESGKMNRSLRDAGGEALVVSQFTLAASTDKGRRPSFERAAPPAEAEVIYERVVARLREIGIPVATGSFGARMHVELVNDGPVTFLLRP